FCYYEAAANELTNPALDPFGKIPEFKYCAVRVTRGWQRPGDPGYGKGRTLGELYGRTARPASVAELQVLADHGQLDVGAAVVVVGRKAHQVAAGVVAVQAVERLHEAFPGRPRAGA